MEQIKTNKHVANTAPDQAPSDTQSTTPTAAEVLVRCLEAEGVEYIFGIPGEENLEVCEALGKSGITFVTVRHEQGAAFMADVYGRLTGKAGVCLATLGPGATNLITGVADANSDGAPLVAITGQVGTERMHLTSHQYLDLNGLYAPITKRTKQIVRPDSIPEVVRIAFKYAQAEKPGAAHIDFPCDIAAMPVAPGPNATPIVPPQVRAEYPDTRDVDEAAALLNAAKRPAILVGSSAVRAHAAEALTQFATDLRIPVVTTMMAKGAVPYDSPYAMGTVGIPQKDYQNEMLDEADLVICVGYDLVEYAPRKWNHRPGRPLVHIDATMAHVNSFYQPSVQVVGDIASALKWLGERCDRHEEPVQMQDLRARRKEEFRAIAASDAFPVKPQRILADIRRVLDPDDILISDVGAHKMWVARHYGCYKPNTCIISNGFASMGIAVPGAIAAKLVHPERKVLAVTGDGGFMMNCQEIETAVRLGVPFVTLIFHDDSYGLIKWKQDDRYGRHRFVDFGNPDFVMFAESMHAHGYRVTSADELVPTLQAAFASGKVCIVDCPVDYSENEKLTQRLQGLAAELGA